MARTTGALLSLGASGSIAKTMVYSSWKGLPYARQWVKPANPNTTEQQLTRSAFKWLTQIYRYMPADATDAWALAAASRQMTAQNLWIKANLALLRTAADITALIASPGANGGLPPAAIAVAPGVGQLAVTLTAPALPAGWAITEAIAIAIRSQDPNTGLLYQVFSAVDNTAPYVPTITGLGAHDYEVFGWFKFTSDTGAVAYGASLSATGTST